MNNCGNCKHWTTSGPYFLQDFGNCTVERDPIRRVSTFFSPTRACDKKNQFTPTATTPQTKESK